ncbi:hypothetical protein V2J09_021151 [Rumex salicifolius]
MVQREEVIRMFVSEIDQQVIEEQLAALFLTCGQLSGLSNVLEVLEMSLKDTQSAKLDDLQYLHESTLIWCLVFYCSSCHISIRPK